MPPIRSWDIMKRSLARMSAALLHRIRVVKPRGPALLTNPLQQIEQLVLTADGLRDSGNAADAAAAYQRVLAHAPARNDIRVQLGNMLKDSNQLTAAETAYRAALQQSDQADTHLQLGHVLKAMGQRAQALMEYQRALELEPNMAGAVQELAEAGDRTQQQRRFDVQLRSGGVEALLTLSQVISSMRAELDRISRCLPEAQAQIAFPAALYATFRDVFPTPPAPMARPLTFHLVLLAEREDVATLFTQISAIQAQSCPAWTLSVLGHDPDRQRVVALAAVSDPRINWIETQGTTNLAAAEQSHAKACTEAWVLLFAAGAVLDPQALAWFTAAARWSAATAFVTDEETGAPMHGGLRRSRPILRQVVDFDSLLETNVFGETLVIQGDAYRRALPALSHSSVTASRVALLLALSSGNGGIGHIPYPLVWRSVSGPIVPAEHREGVAAYLAFAGLQAAITVSPAGTVIWRSHLPPAAIAVIILTRDNAPDVVELVHSLRKTADAPQALEIIVVDNGSQKTDNVQILQALTHDGIRVLRLDTAFNWSYLNNEAAAQTQAPLLLFANDDMRMISEGWDSRLRGLLERSDIGAVGARLLYTDDTVQHAGVLFGWKGSVIHDGLFEDAAEPGPACRWKVTRAVGAVTGAFLATRRILFLELGGFDAVSLPVAYSDIDYALKVRMAGLKILWTPAITLYHYETKTRGLDQTDAWRAARNEHERSIMETRWGMALNNEPSVHPCWHAATLPFRLMSAPSGERVRQHIVQTGSAKPWTEACARAW